MILSENPFLNMKCICRTVWDDNFFTSKYQVVWRGWGSNVLRHLRFFLRVDFCEVI